MNKVSAILCHHKGRDLLLKSIASLKAQKRVQLEIIVVTSDATLELANIKTVLVQGGPAYKRNIGLRYAMYDLIAFFDDDIEAEPSCVYEMAKFLTDNQNVGMVFGKLLNMEKRDRFDEAGSFLTDTGFLLARAGIEKVDTGQFDTAEPILSGKSASCMITRNAFIDAGMFDADFFILGEETDLAWRVWMQGYSVYYVPSSICLHAFNTKWKPVDYYSLKRIYTFGCRNYLTMLTKNLPSNRLTMALFCQFSAWILSAIGMACVGKFGAGWHILKGLYEYLKSLPATLRKRRKVQGAMLVSHPDILQYIVKNPGWRYYAWRFLRYLHVGLHG